MSGAVSAGARRLSAFTKLMRGVMRGGLGIPVRQSSIRSPVCFKSIRMSSTSAVGATDFKSAHAPAT